MRFVKAFTDQRTGEVAHVMEQEMPFLSGDPEPYVLVPLSSGGFLRQEFDPHELGLAEDFTPVHVETGARCSPAAHLFQRLEHIVSAPSDLRGAARFRARHGYELPSLIECPCTLDGIKQRLRDRGVDGIPAMARAWLTLMLPPEESRAMGIDDAPISVIRALDAMRQRRDPSVGSRAFVLERRAQQRAESMARTSQANGER